MSALFYVMAVFGCGDGAAQCVEARLAGRRFETQAACVRMLEDVLTGSTDVDAPSISARCMSATAYIATQPDKRRATLKLAALSTR